MSRPAFGSPEHNGNQQSVLNAIQQGLSDPTAIATWLSLDTDQVRNAIKRLVHSGTIRRKHLGGYEITRKDRALAEAWK